MTIHALTWYGMVRYLNNLNAVIACPTSLLLKARKAQSDLAKLDDTRTSHLPQARYNWILVQVILLAGCYFNGVHP